ncbi:hypothetical protein [Methanocalculus chunghsingensis]|uniref:hypothetical protein n=1 Tax=Methanocalculus chunghsingensis TaxID=156457 RepID=UPI001B8B88B0|nr:hypothetical protein [Methanocalculus chunghsingensis]
MCSIIVDIGGDGADSSPFLEQEEIVRRVNTLLAFADQIEARVTTTQERTKQLRQSILEQAFSGRLVGGGLGW